jgi:predicted alpha-1,2-mannosidase
MRVHRLTALAAFVLACSSDEAVSPSAGGASAGGAGGAGGAPAATSFKVDPFIGSGGFAYAAGSSFPGASAPLGLAKVGPDTIGPWATVNFLHYCGYWYGDDRIQGFSHMHLHGTGATDYGVLGVMPVDGFDASKTTMEGHTSPFQKSSEKASPGRYSVTLDNGGIGVDLTATTRAAHHRYTWPAASTSGTVVFDLAHHLNDVSTEMSDVTLYPQEQRARGSLRTKGGMSGGFTLYFEIKTKTAWSQAQTWADGSAPVDGTKVTGKQGGFALTFPLSGGAPVEVQIGLSLVSPDGAAAALATELPAWDFDGTAKATAAEWSAITDRIRVTGATETERTMFKTALYHAFLMPSVHSDVDGSFTGPDGVVHKADGYRYVTDLSLWDTYRTVQPLYDLAYPEASREVVRSLVDFAKIAGFFPKWTVGNVDAGTMIGASAEAMLSDAWVKGVRDFDAEWSYQTMLAAATSPTPPPGGRGGRDGVELYMKYGYIPSITEDGQKHGGSVSRTFELGADDYSLSRLADGLGHASEAAMLEERSHSYRALFDPAAGFLRAKKWDGTFSAANINPSQYTDDYVEANGIQSGWVPWDPEGMAQLFGSKEAYAAALDTFFQNTKMEWDGLDPDPMSLKGKGAQRPFYRVGNEGDIHVPFLLTQAGRPDLAQKWVRWTMAQFFGTGPDGLPGNDDGGATSCFYVWAALGFYPIAGSDRYIVGVPLFEHAEIDVPGGMFTIEAPGASATKQYVQSVTLNGAPLTAPELRHADLKAGGSLKFVMGDQPVVAGQ